MMNTLNEDSQQKRRVAIYIRVSTAEQKIDGYSFDAQKKKLLEYIENNKHAQFETKKEWVFEDVGSGADINRSGYKKMMEGVRSKSFDTVLVWKIDRLSRSLQQLLATFEVFEAHQVSFVSIQENIDFRGPIGKLIFQIFGAIAQFERELIKGRTRMGKIASAELGNYTGHSIPYGYKPVINESGKGKKLSLIKGEKIWVEKIYNWYIYDGLGDKQIAKKLNELKVARGKHTRLKKDRISPWSEPVVRKVLTSEIYRGEFVANKKDDSGVLLPEAQWTIVKIPSCVSEFTFQQAQETRKNRKSTAASTHYLLSGKLKDITLEKPRSFVGAPRYKGGYSYRRKQFKMKDGTHVPVFEIPCKPIDEYVWQKVVEAMEKPEVFIEHYLSKEYSNPKKIELLEEQLETLREQHANLTLSIFRIEEAYENGVYSEEKMSEKLTEKNNSISKAETEIQDTQDQLQLLSSIDVEVEKLKEASAQVKYRLEHLTDKQKKMLCNLFVERVEMYRKRDGKRWKVSAEVYFRFNPKKFSEEALGGRTQRALKQEHNKNMPVKSSLDGAQERT